MSNNFNFLIDNVHIYVKENLLKYAKCPIRGEIELPEYKPEELVRLALLDFLTICNCYQQNLYSIKVETDRLDITLYNKKIGDLVLFHPPALVIETKRRDYPLIQAVSQLSDYLIVNKCQQGLLFNCSQAYICQKINNGFDTIEIFTIHELEQFIFNCIDSQQKELELELNEYIAAKNGDFDSFINLAIKYRRSKRICFVINQRNIEYIIIGHLFDYNMDENVIKYTLCGYDTKSENKPFFNKHEFIRLENITT